MRRESGAFCFALRSINSLKNFNFTTILIKRLIQENAKKPVLKSTGFKF